MLVLFTDFGMADPYVGQLHGVLAQRAPGVEVIDLLHAVPDFDVRAGAYLLPALVNAFPLPAVFACVVDPGVGGERRALIVEADGRRFVGPDNGLFTLLARRAKDFKCREILWRPQQLSASFHGRDLFAPVAAMLVSGEAVDSRPCELSRPGEPADWPDDLPAVIYIDHYGNAVTGLRAETVAPDARLQLAGRELEPARTFSAVAPGEAFWYANAFGLVEIAVNRGSATRDLDLALGDAVTMLE